MVRTDRVPYISKLELRARGPGRKALPSIAVVLCALGQALATPARAQDFVPGEVLVKARASVAYQDARQVHALNGCVSTARIEQSGVERLKISNGQPVEAMVALYSADARFEYAEPNYIGQGGAFTPDDTNFDLQWHLQNTGSGGTATVGADIGAVEAWEISRGSNAIRVAVLDTGIDSDHPEFAGRIEPGFDFVNGDADPEDDHSHGTWVTGLLAANADNAFGVAGVDHFVKIVPVKILSSLNLGTSFALAQGLEFAKDRAEVISMSLVRYPVESVVIKDALQSARDAGAILISCAGNEGIGAADLWLPSASPLTISVGATLWDDSRASFSGTGAALDLVAPGLAVETVIYNSGEDSSSTFNGCSASTPIVAGAATLLLSQDPSLTHDEIAVLLMTTADDQVGAPAEDTPGRDDFMGHGRLNIAAAFAALSAMSPLPAVSIEGGTLAAGLLLALGTLAALRPARRHR